MRDTQATISDAGANGVPDGGALPQSESRLSVSFDIQADLPALMAARPREIFPNTPLGRQSFIRMVAGSYGISPDFAVAIAEAEGLRSERPSQGSYVDVYPTGDAFSFWDFQLNYRNGLGLLAREAGIDPRNPGDWWRADEFALRYMAENGFGPWCADPVVRTFQGQRRVARSTGLPPAALDLASSIMRSLLADWLPIDPPDAPTMSAFAGGEQPDDSRRGEYSSGVGRRATIFSPSPRLSNDGSALCILTSSTRFSTPKSVNAITLLSSRP